MKKTVTQLTSDIDAYSALLDPLSIDPVLDGGIKKNILETLNNKARSQAILKLALIPSGDLPTTEIGEDGDFYIYILTTPIIYTKNSGVWNAVEATNDMFFFNDGIDGIRRYYSLSDDLLSIVLVHSIDFGDISGSAVKFVPQTLTPLEQTQARTNIDAAAKTYVDNLFDQLLKAGASGTEGAGTVKPWYFESTIPTSWVKINDVQTWYLKSEYPDLYAALGGELNPFGVTTTSFSIPYEVPGTSLVKEGTGFAAMEVGGEEEHTLTGAESGLPVHEHDLAIQAGSTTAGGVLRWVVEKLGVGSLGMANFSKNGTGSGDGGSPAPGYAKSTLNGNIITKNAETPHNNMPPYRAVFFIIKLSNADNPAILDSELPYKNLIVQTISENTTFNIPAGTIIKDVNIMVITGNPTINLPVVPVGDLVDQTFYSLTPNLPFPVAGNLQVNVSGGTVKIQIVKVNI